MTKAKTARDTYREFMAPTVQQAAWDMQVSTSQIWDALDNLWEARYEPIEGRFHWACAIEGFELSIEVSPRIRLDGSAASAQLFAAKMAETGVYAAAALCRWRNRKEIPPEVKL